MNYRIFVDYSAALNFGGADLGILSSELISGITSFTFRIPKRFVSINFHVAPLSEEMAIRLDENSTSPSRLVKKVDCGKTA
jgi:hypothetical protein